MTYDTTEHVYNNNEYHAYTRVPLHGGCTTAFFMDQRASLYTNNFCFPFECARLAAFKL